MNKPEKKDISGMFSQTNKEPKKKSKKRKASGKPATYDLIEPIIDHIRETAKGHKAPNGGYAVLLLLNGLRHLDSLDPSSYLELSESRAYIHKWDYERMEKEAAELLEGL